ncbi:MAG: hypothetical protein K2G24_09390 [Muribaculaceae bacterium]|nr:hypothetical protein [Muribaculaceae bacterium]
MERRTCVVVLYGMPHGSASGAGLNRRKYSGKELITFSGYDAMDYHARWRPTALPLFTTPDPMCEKTYPISLYAYCGGDPVNRVDPTGEDIVVLNFGTGASQHLAMLILDENGEWRYYSVNGNNVVNPITKEHIGGRKFNDVAVGPWNSPEDFFKSKYNVRDDDSKDDKSKNNFGFTEGYLIFTTPEQDAIMRKSFSKTAKSEYDLFNNNCATAVQKAMVEAGIPVSEPKMVPSYIPMSTPFGIVDVINGYHMECEFKTIPSFVFESIKEWNPSGVYICK